MVIIEGPYFLKLFLCSNYKGPVVVLSLTVEWGVSMERQDPSYGVVVHTSVLRVQALLEGSNSPTSRSPDWFLCI